MRIVHLRWPVAPRGDGFYEVGRDGIGDGPFIGEGARARFALMLAAGVAVWLHDPSELHEAEDEEHLRKLMYRAEAEDGPMAKERAEVGPTKKDRVEAEARLKERVARTRAALAVAIRGATVVPPSDRPSGPMP